MKSKIRNQFTKSAVAAALLCCLSAAGAQQSPNVESDDNRIVLIGDVTSQIVASGRGRGSSQTGGINILAQHGSVSISNNDAIGIGNFDSSVRVNETADGEFRAQAGLINLITETPQ